jgi:hypothetical protein
MTQGGYEKFHPRQNPPWQPRCPQRSVLQPGVHGARARFTASLAEGSTSLALAVRTRSAAEAIPRCVLTS